MSAELGTLAADPSRIEHVAAADLPALIGAAEALRAMLWARLQVVNVAAPSVHPEANGKGPDRLLTADEAASRLAVDRRWMYRHAESLPFTRRLSSGTLRFSERGLLRWQETRR